MSLPADIKIILATMVFLCLHNLIKITDNAIPTGTRILLQAIKAFTNIFATFLSRVPIVCKTRCSQTGNESESRECPDRSTWWLVRPVVTQWETQQQQRKFRSSPDERADSRKRAGTQVKDLYCREWHLWSNGAKPCGAVAGEPPQWLLACVESLKTAHAHMVPKMINT